jgi:hypothetical protein
MLCGAMESHAAATAGAFLQDGDGARGAGMGEAYSAVVRDAGAMYWNPAALASIPGGSATLMRSSMPESAAVNYLAYGQRVAGTWGVGASVLQRTAGSLTRWDDTGTEIGSFTPTDTVYSAGAAKRWGALSAGLSVKAVKSTVVDSASTMAEDAGVLWTRDRLSIALTSVNMGGKLNYGRESEKIPAAYRLGAGYRFGKGVLLEADAVSPAGGNTYAAVGAEWVAVEDKSLSLALRAGYSNRDAGSGAAVGLGFAMRGLSLDYAFVPKGDLGAVHRISLGYSFKTESKEVSTPASRPAATIKQASAPRPLASPKPSASPQPKVSPKPATSPKRKGPKIY